MLDPLIPVLHRLLAAAPVIRLDGRLRPAEARPGLSRPGQDRLVVFSDLHVGNRGRSDDFLKNADLFMTVLRRHYLDLGYTLVLNGDIEELLRFSLGEIESAWPDLFDLFGEFDREGRLYKIVGNHDLALPLYREYPFRGRLLEALKLQYRDDTLFIFHGHQASGFHTRFSLLVGLSLRYLARPLGIKNYSVSRNLRRRFRMERRVYAFSHAGHLASLVGHTHRPLFESLSKVDALRFRIEQLCRQYTTAAARARPRLAEEIRRHKAELEGIEQLRGERPNRPGIYTSRLLIPCLFNSGCGIGKRGITAIEVGAGDIALVHWFDRQRSRKHFDLIDEAPQQLDGSDYFRVVLKQDSLDYIFTRIRLLAD